VNELRWSRHLALGTTALAVAAVAPMVIALSIARPWLVGLAAVPLLVLVLEVASGDPPDLTIVTAVENRAVTEGTEIRLFLEISSTADGVVHLYPNHVGGMTGRLASRSVEVSRHDPTTIELTGLASGWGRASVGLARVDWRSPLGLISWQSEVDVLETIWVYPKPTRLRSHLGVSSTTIRWGPHLSPARGNGVEYHSTRPFEAGDRWRDLDHRALAKTGEAWVKARHAEQSRDLVVVVDLIDDGQGARSQTASLADQALRAAEAVTQRHIAERDRVGLVVIGARVLAVPVRDGRRQSSAIVDKLMRAVPRQPTFYPGHVVDLRRRIPSGATVLVISPLLDAAIVEQVHALRRYGRDVAVLQVGHDLVQRRRESMKLSDRRAVDLHRLRAEATRTKLRSERIAVQTCSYDESPIGAVESLQLLHRSMVRRHR